MKQDRRILPRMRRMGVVAAACAISMGAAAAPALAATAQQPVGEIMHANVEGAISGSYLVMLNGSPAEASIQSEANALTSEYGGTVTHSYDAALYGFAADMSAEQAKRLAADARVKYVEQDAMAHATGTQDNATWGLDRVDQRDLPLDGTYSYPNEGTGATVYSVDTGVRVSHNEFGGRASNGYDFVDNDRVANDCNGHGTHTSGTMASDTYGVAKGTDLVAVRVLGCDGRGAFSQIADGIDWVVDNHSGPSVMNLSIGGPANSTADQAVRNAVSSGVVAAVAAGNSDEDACGSSPARVEEAITIGSTTKNDGRSSFSNYGRCLDIFGPGSNITSTWNGSDNDTNTISGTSMATPHVAGTAAMYLTENPSADPQQVRDALVDNASSGKVGNPGSGSPNKLIYTGFIGGGDEPPEDPDDPPEDPDDPPDEPGDLDVSLSPSSSSVQSGQFAFSTVTVGGADAATQLSASGAPAGARVQFSPSSVAAGESSQVFISTSFNTPAGSYEITISGNDGDETGQATYTLNVRNPFGGF